METILVEPRRRCRHRHAQPAGEAQRGRRHHVARAARRVPRGRGGARRQSVGGHGCRGRILLRCRPHRLPAIRRHTARLHARRRRRCLALYEMPKPTIAKVPGVAAGAGWNLALACDLVAAADSARFSQIFVQRGRTIDFGGSWILPRLVGLQRAKELCFFGDMLSAAEVLDLGLLNRVVADDELDTLVDDWARRLAAGPPLALSMTKSLLGHGFSTSIEQALEDEARCQSVCFAERGRAGGGAGVHREAGARVPGTMTASRDRALDSGASARRRHRGPTGSGFPALRRPGDRRVDAHSRRRLDGRVLGRHVVARRTGVRRRRVRPPGGDLARQAPRPDRVRDRVPRLLVLVRRGARPGVVRQPARRDDRARRPRELATLYNPDAC